MQLGIRLKVRFGLDLVGERCLASVAATIAIAVALRLILSIARRSGASSWCALGRVPALNLAGATEDVDPSLPLAG
jgi:hypothetical protein